MDNSQIIIILLITIITILIAIACYLLYLCISNNKPVYPIINTDTNNNTNYDNSGSSSSSSSSSKLSINTNTDVYDSSDNMITPTFSRVLEIRPSTPVNSPRRRTKI